MTPQGSLLKYDSPVLISKNNEDKQETAKVSNNIDYII